MLFNEILTMFLSKCRVGQCGVAVRSSLIADSLLADTFVEITSACRSGEGSPPVV